MVLTKSDFYVCFAILLTCHIQTSFSQDPGPDVKDATEDEKIDELRRQMIIITSIIGGVCILTLILVLALAVSISKMKARFTNKHERYLPSSPDEGTISPTRPSTSRQEIHSYDNNAFNSGAHEMEERRIDAKHEVERLGYEMYNGKHENRNSSYALRSDRFVNRTSEDLTDGLGRPTATPTYDIGVQIRPKRYTTQLPRATTTNSGSHQLRMDEGVAPMTHSTPNRDNYNRRSGSGERSYRY